MTGFSELEPEAKTAEGRRAEGRREKARKEEGKKGDSVTYSDSIDRHALYPQSSPLSPLPLHYSLSRVCLEVSTVSHYLSLPFLWSLSIVLRVWTMKLSIVRFALAVFGISPCCLPS